MTRNMFSGPALLATDDWKAAVERRMKDPGDPWTRQRLADALDCSPAAITRALKPETERSRLVGPICDLFRLPYPEIPISSPKAARLLAMADELSDDQIDALVVLAETFLRSNNT